MDRRNIGSDFTDFLREEGILDEVRDIGKPTMAKNESIKGEVESVLSSPNLVEVTDRERAVLRTVLYRDFTAKLAHGGLGPLLSLTPDETEVLVGFLRRV